MANNNSLADILNIDGGDGSFDDDEARKARERQEERDYEARQLREKMKALSESDDDDAYKRKMLKMLNMESMEVLSHMKNEIEDNPSPRAAETFATVVNSIAGNIDSLEKLDNNQRKHEIDKQKVAVASAGPQGLTMGSNNNVVMVGNTNDLLDMLNDGGLIGGDKKEIKDAEAEVIEEVTEEKSEDKADGENDEK